MMREIIKDVAKDIAVEAVRGGTRGAFGALSKRVMPKHRKALGRIAKPKSRAMSRHRKHNLW